MALAIPATASDTASLLRNGGFETGGVWTLSAGATIDSAQPHSGARCLKVVTAENAVAEQIVYGVKPGQTFTACGWLRTESVVPRGGSGYAFLALYQLDADGRIVAYRDFAQQSGTAGWAFASLTFRADPAVRMLSVRAGICTAHGTAWFDDINLVPGDRAEPWQEPTGAAAPRAYRAAILDEPGLPVQGCATPVATFRAALAAEGVPLTPLSADRLADPDVFNADRFDLLIVPTGATFPIEARGALISFLTRGGDLWCTGGYAFDHLVVRGSGSRTWTPYADLLAEERRKARNPEAARIRNGGFEDGEEGWYGSVRGQCSVVEERPYFGRHCGRVTAPAVGKDARYETALGVEPGDTYLVGAHARSEDVVGPGYGYMAVYQYDREGKLVAFRDFAQLKGTREWERHEFQVSIVPSAARVMFYAGLYNASGTIWLDEVTCARMPREERINAHYGEPLDGLGIGPLQLTLFSPDQPIAGQTLEAAAGGPLQPQSSFHLAGAVMGFEATAQLQSDARWLPLVDARDSLGRLTGAAGALVTKVGGPFCGSTWALFGVTNRDIFAGPGGIALARRVLRLLARRVHAESLTAGYAIYHPGETVAIQLRLAARRNLPTTRATGGTGASGATGETGYATGWRIRLELSAPAGADPTGKPARRTLYSVEDRLAIPPDSRSEVPFTWRVPAGAPAFVAVRARVLSPEGACLDRIETGFCVYDPSVVMRGPRTLFHNNAFELSYPGRKTQRVTLFGTDTYGNMFVSPSANPLTWYRDLSMMRDSGLHMFENLQYAPYGYRFTEAQIRQLDALIQMAQGFGLTYMAGLLVGQDVAVDDATLAKQAEMCRAFAARYRSTPGLIYYLNGDFQLELKDTPDLRRLWNGFLQQRYGSEAGLRRAWGKEARPEPLGQIPVFDAPADGLFDVRACDVHLFRKTLMRRWIGALCSAIRAEDPVHPITSEYYQRPYDGVDLRLSADLMDVANYGFFAPPREDIATLLATIKWNDMRFAGKSVNIGEFGVKTHDAWAASRGAPDYHVARTQTEALQLLWSIAQAALACGVSKIQNWCWSDDPDHIFPWGLAWNNPLHPKPILSLYRNLRILSSRFPIPDARAPILLLLNDRWRLGVSDGLGRGGLTNAIECLLAAGAPFDVANLSDLPSIEGRRPAVILAPLAYAMTEADVDALRRLAEAGSKVYLSGDVEIDPEGRREPGRLQRLCGVRLVREAAHASGLSMPEVECAGAERVACSRPLFRCAAGKGAIFYSPEPWETLPGRDILVRNAESCEAASENLYVSLLPEMGVEPTVRVSAPGGAWRALDTASGSLRLITLFPRSLMGGVTPVTVRASGATIGFGVSTGWPCAALLDASGQAVAAAAGREVTVKGVEAARGSGPWALVSLDGLPLNRSQALAAFLVEGGRLRWSSSAKGLSACIVEWRQGKAIPIASAPLKRQGAAWEASAGPNDLMLIAPSSAAGRWLRALDR
jgi:hypothetical protein